MTALPSHHITQGMDAALNRIYFHAMGLTREDLDRPLVGVAAAWDGSAPAGDLPLRMARTVEEGVWAGGGTPRQFATIADNVDGLVIRELVADSVELTMRGHSYDGLVGVAAGPNALAGLLLALCRLDVPGLIVPVTGAGIAPDPEAQALARAAEALGLALPDPGPTLTGLIAAATASGAEAGRRLAEGITPRATLTRDALVRASDVLVDFPALLVHLAAIAHECGVDFDLEAAAGTRWIRGSLAPDGAIQHGDQAATGTARVFDDEDAACAWVADGWPAGSVLVVRQQGPAGAPGMPSLTALAAAIAGAGAPQGALLVTDGRAPAIPGVTCVSAVGPEAAAGGPLARLRDGDVVTLGAAGLDAEVGDGVTTPSRDPVSPALDKYRRTVGPALIGATTHPGAAAETVRYADL